MQDFEDWDLVLLNRALIAQDVTLTIHSSDGKPYPSTSLSLTRKETRHIDVRSLLPTEAVEAEIGGIQLEYYGPPRTVAAHIVIRGFHGFGNLGVPLLEGSEFKSTTLDAIWWEPIGARSYLVLGNSSNETVHAEIIFGSGAKQGVDLPPFAIQTKPFLYGSDDGPAEGRISSAQITYSGTPGTLRAAGFSTSFSEHFFDTIAFVDPKLSTESALYANGLHLADVSGHLLVKNISDTPIAVSGGIYPLGRARSMKPFPVLPKSLAAGESVELPLPVPGGSMARPHGWRAPEALPR